MDNSDAMTVDSWGGATQMTSATLALIPDGQGGFYCPKHPSEHFSDRSGICGACEREFQEHRRQLQERRNSVNKQLAELADRDILKDLQQSLAQMKPGAEEADSRPDEAVRSANAPLDSPLPMASMDVMHAAQQQQQQQQHPYAPPPTAYSAAPPHISNLPPRYPPGPAPAPQHHQQQLQQQQQMLNPFMQHHNPLGPSSLDALAMQIQRTQQIQDWMLLQKEQECNALKEKLDRATEEIQLLRVENALLQEKLHQQEQRMQHELKLIKLAAMQHRSSRRSSEKGHRAALPESVNSDQWVYQDNNINRMTVEVPYSRRSDNMSAGGGKEGAANSVETTGNSTAPNSWHSGMEQYPQRDRDFQHNQVTPPNGGSSNSSSESKEAAAFDTSAMQWPTATVTTTTASNTDTQIDTNHDDAFDPNAVHHWPTEPAATKSPESPKKTLNKFGLLSAAARMSGRSPPIVTPASATSVAEEKEIIDEEELVEEQRASTPAPAVTATVTATETYAPPTKGWNIDRKTAADEAAKYEAATKFEIIGVDPTSKNAVPEELHIDDNAPPEVALKEEITFGTTMYTRPLQESIVDTITDTKASVLDTTKQMTASEERKADEDEMDVWSYAPGGGLETTTSKREIGVDAADSVASSSVRAGSVMTGISSTTSENGGSSHVQLPPKYPYQTTQPPVQAQIQTNPTSQRSSISFADDNASVGLTVASSTYGEDRVKVVDQTILDPYGDRGTFTGVILRSTGMPHGTGRMIYQEDSREYHGEWRHGRWHGFGKATFANGDSYEGEYRFDQRHGRGRYEWHDGRVYDGMFREDKRHGKGKFMWPDGAVYEGEFNNGQREGEGTYKFSDGGMYQGSWKAGRYDGFGICSWEDGRTYKGEWRSGAAHGRGVETFADGSIRHDGLWAFDEPVSSDT